MTSTANRHRLSPPSTFDHLLDLLQAVDDCLEDVQYLSAPGAPTPPGAPPPPIAAVLHPASWDRLHAVARQAAAHPAVQFRAVRLPNLTTP